MKMQITAYAGLNKIKSTELAKFSIAEKINPPIFNTETNNTI